MTDGGPSGRGWRRVHPRLIIVTDTTVAPEGVIEPRIERALALARPAMVMVQLRDTALSVRRRLALGERLLAICRRHGQLLVVNDRVDLAVLLGADGVHLGEASIASEDARKLLSPGAWISRACHAPSEVAHTDADAALLSPIAAPRKGRAALGLAALSEARARRGSASPLLYALGGIDAESAARCVARGAAGVAVIGAVLDGRDPEPLVRALGIVR